VAGHPLGQRRPPHYWPRTTPDRPRGWSGHPQKAKRQKKKKKKKVRGLGRPDNPKGFGGGPATPKRPRNQKQKKK
jgi:hypothetical protein